MAGKAKLALSVHSDDSKPGGKSKSKKDGTLSGAVFEEEDTDLIEDPSAYNTYKLAPDKTMPYCEVENMMKTIVNKHLSEQSYSANLCRDKCKEVSDEVVNSVKSLGFGRYRIVCSINFAQYNQEQKQSLKIASRCLWDTNFDRSASVTLVVNDIIATCMTYMVYME